MSSPPHPVVPHPHNVNSGVEPRLKSSLGSNLYYSPLTSAAAQNHDALPVTMGPSASVSASSSSPSPSPSPPTRPKHAAIVHSSYVPFTRAHHYANSVTSNAHIITPSQHVVNAANNTISPSSSSSSSSSTSLSLSTSSSTSTHVHAHADELKMFEDAALPRRAHESTVAAIMRDASRDMARNSIKIDKMNDKEKEKLNSIRDIKEKEREKERLLHKYAHKPAAAAASPTPPVSDFNMLTILTQRLTTLEKIVAKQERELALKESEVSALRASSSSSYDRQQLLQQCEEMEQFLQDYGMKWAGFRAEVIEQREKQRDIKQSKETNNNNNNNNNNSDKDASKHKASSNSATSSPTLTASSSSPPKNSTLTSSPSLSSSSPAAPPSSSSSSSSTSSSSSSSQPPADFSPSRFLSALHALSQLADAAPTISNEHGTAKFKAAPTVHVILYADGLWLDAGPLRTWSDDATQEFIHDVMDGYFPYEFKSKYPEGVVFTTENRFGVRCNANNEEKMKKFKAFTGVGRRLENGENVLHSDAEQKLLAKLSQDDVNMLPPTTQNAPPPAFPSISAFLASLPASVIKDGKIIPVREEMKKRMEGKKDHNHEKDKAENKDDGEREKHREQEREKRLQLSSLLNSSSSSTSTTTPALTSSASAGSLSTSLSNVSISSTNNNSTNANANKVMVPTPAAVTRITRPNSARKHHKETTTLHIKFDGPHTPLLLQLRPDDTLDQVYEYIRVELASSRINFELRSLYPPRVFQASKETLRQAGLTPNASLAVKTISSPINNGQRPASAYREKKQ